MSVRKYTEKIRESYENHLAKHDPDSPEAVHWIGKDKTWLRFEVLAEVDDLNNKRLLDFGCGNALLLDFLKEHGVECEYYGWDISEKMIQIARKRHPSAHFDVVDVLKDRSPEMFGDFFDYVLVSGVFNLKAGKEDTHRKWTESILLKLWDLCKKGLAVNFLTDYVDWKEKWGSHERRFLYLTRILGDISHWKNMDFNELKQSYRFHYLLPFNLLHSHSRFTTKDKLVSFMPSQSGKMNSS